MKNYYNKKTSFTRDFIPFPILINWNASIGMTPIEILNEIKRSRIQLYDPTKENVPTIVYLDSDTPPTRLRTWQREKNRRAKLFNLLANFD